MVGDPLSTGASPVRVAAFTGTFLPGYKAGGPVKSMVQLLDSLPETIVVDLYTSDRDLGDTEPYPGLSGVWSAYRHHRVFRFNPRRPSHWLAVMRSVRNAGPSVLYLNSLWSPWFTIVPILLHVLRLAPARRILLAPRGELSEAAQGISSTKKRLFLVVWRPLLRMIGCTWQASSQAEQQDILRAFPWARVLTQRNSPGDAPAAEIVPSTVRPKLTYVGRISPIKNVLLAIEAVRASATPLDFDIYGPLEDREYWESCREAASTAPADVVVTYKGPLRSADVRPTLASYDAFIFPTSSENFGHVIAESLSVGCPVVTSTNTPWTATLEDGGGVPEPSFDPGVWAAHVRAIARQPSEQRSAAKLRALNAYIRWRGAERWTSALERFVNEMPSPGRP